jgi:thiol-disulfide isomerase/thioredoxin
MDKILLVLRVAAVLLVLSLPSAAAVIGDVRGAIASSDFKRAAEVLADYRKQHGVNPEYLEALSWLARGKLSANDLEQAYRLARETEELTLLLLKDADLDEEPHLATALGAALEVRAQALSRQNKTESAVLLLRDALRTYGGSSIRSRLQKNLNLLTLVGRAAPPLVITEYLGSKPKALEDLKGSVVLIFFWAHWCGDCKSEAPSIARLLTDFKGQDFVVVAPTQRYGFAGGQEQISAEQETKYIDSVRQRYYRQLSGMAIPLSSENFDRYGASTTPTIVVLARDGNVEIYHPGGMTYAELRHEIEKLLGSR